MNIVPQLTSHSEEFPLPLFPGKDGISPFCGFLNYHGSFFRCLSFSRDLPSTMKSILKFPFLDGYLERFVAT